MKLTKLNLLLLAVLLVVVNFTYLNLPLSAGDRYFERLQHWYYLAQKGQWIDASKISGQIDAADIVAYRQFHDPSEIQKTIDEIMSKQDKSADDWAEIANLEKTLGKNKEASVAAARAHQLDPVRDDITQLYYQLSK